MEKYQIVLTLTEPMLGTVPLNKEIYSDYVASAAPQPVSDEIETVTVDETIEKGTTGFHRVDGKPIIYNYLIKGFAKEACGMMRRVEGSLSSKIAAHKRIIDGMVFVFPRQIPVILPPEGKEEILERPLRAQTPQGERVALARSETVPAGSTLTFEIRILGAVSEALLREWLDYGAYKALGQWRNGGYGTFEYTLKKL